MACKSLQWLAKASSPCHLQKPPVTHKKAPVACKNLQSITKAFSLMQKPPVAHKGLQCPAKASSHTQKPPVAHKSIQSLAKTKTKKQSHKSLQWLTKAFSGSQKASSGLQKPPVVHKSLQLLISLQWLTKASIKDLQSLAETSSCSQKTSISHKSFFLFQNHPQSCSFL